MAQQITRIPLKYGPILNTISDESVGKIFKNILGGSESLNETEQIYFDLIMVDINNIQLQVNIGSTQGYHGNKGGRPKNNPPGDNLNNPPGDNLNNPKYSIVKNNKDKIKEDIESENLNDFLPPQELDKFIAHRTEPFQRGVMKGKQKREGEKTRDLKKRMTTWKNNYETNFGKIKPKSTDPTSKDYFEWYKQNIVGNEKFEDPLQPGKMVTYSQNNYQYYLVNKHGIDKQEAIKIKDKFLDI